MAALIASSANMLREDSHRGKEAGRREGGAIMIDKRSSGGHGRQAPSRGRERGNRGRTKAVGGEGGTGWGREEGRYLIGNARVFNTSNLIPTRSEVRPSRRKMTRAFCKRASLDREGEMERIRPERSTILWSVRHALQNAGGVLCHVYFKESLATVRASAGKRAPSPSCSGCSDS